MLTQYRVNEKPHYAQAKKNKPFNNKLINCNKGEEEGAINK